MSSSLDDVDIDEILRIIDEEENPKAKENKPKKKRKQNASVNRFIRNKGIMSGDVRVPTYVIFHQYRQFILKSTPNSAVGKTEFFRTFNVHFEKARTGKQRYYLLNDAIDMSEEAIKLAKFYENSAHVKNSKKKEE